LSTTTKDLYFQPGADLELFPQQETPPTVVAGAGIEPANLRIMI
jgi:hypothetical protein